MIAMSNVASNYALDLRETFDNVRKHKMRLKLAKFSFGLTFGKFLGILISQQGIEANPSQIKAITEMPNPKNIKQVQKLTGCIAALRRFIPQASKKFLPFFKVIKDASKIHKLVWNKECEQSFLTLKEFLSNPPILVQDLPRERLKIYL